MSLSKQNIGVQFTIMQGANSVYVETQNATTDTFGLYALVIGKGAVVSGTFNSIHGQVATFPFKLA